MRRFVILLFIALVSACTPNLPPPPTPTLTPTLEPTPMATPVNYGEEFPLEEGNVWVYEGTVRWQHGADVKEETVTWTMAVVEIIERGPVRGIRLKGHPADLTWYEPGQQPRDHFIIQVNNKFYEGFEETWQRLQDPEDFLIDLVSEGMLMLDLPLWSGKSFGEAAQLTRPDGFYHWLVTEEEIATLDKVTGISNDEPLTRYTVAFRTNPDHQIVDFVPGVGITHYIYSHHGTVSDVDVVLTEFQTEK
ncbi:MAG TPA: hypothetical protein PKE64_02035 [Anaerolineae bacterium]|nr:hypothetical protein [Anaerolineae bacterium]HMR62766.1 hypothetical protein [Anaerolineae bacterium]